MKSVTVVSLVLLALGGAVVQSKPLVCYFSSWAVYRQGDAKFDVENIDPFLCTHLVYSFIRLDEGGNLALMDSWTDERIFNAFKTDILVKNPDLKILAAVGGWNHGPWAFQAVVKDPARRATMINSAVDLLKKYGLHGLDIDWEYQDKVGGSPEERDGFSQLAREMRARFDQEGLLVTAATSANFDLMVANYDLAALSSSLHMINVMAYDLHGGWDKVTGHVAPTHARGDEAGADRNLNVEAVLRRYIELGADPAKLNLGFITYGRTFTLSDAGNSGVGAPVTGPGLVGDIIPEAGTYAYWEYCSEGSQWTRNWIQDQQVPYAVKGDQWLGIDDLEAVQGKLDLLHSLQLGGAMVWSIETDDHKGVCGPRNPIINAVKNGL